MNLLHVCAVIAALCLGSSSAYSKYGRTCKDIGCLNNEVCVMESDPCSYYQRQDECGSYPNCKKKSAHEAPSCTNYVCPPTHMCQMTGQTPKCVEDPSKRHNVGYDTTALKNNAPSQNSQLYPQLPRGETTPRPNIGYQPANGQGYQGGRIGSGYPGQPQQQGYPQQPYPGYYPQGNYQQPPPSNGYNGYNYNNQRYNPQYNPYGQQGQNSGASGGLFDSLTSALKNYGMFYLIGAVLVQGWIN